MFVPISKEKYIELYLKNNPSENKVDVEKNLDSALLDYKKGVKCKCGNDIWVVGSAVVGNACFTCITGESTPDEDYEIESAIRKSPDRKGRRHIDDIDPTKIAGFFDDDGYEIIRDLIKKPGLCITCKKNDNPNEELLCDMNRYDQRDSLDFKCYAYEPKKQ